MGSASLLAAIPIATQTALREASEVDSRFGFVLNNDLAGYIVPVNADVGELDLAFVNKPDPVLNAPGVKGPGEVAITGVAAAITNAVYHAPGTRVRQLPIRIESLIRLSAHLGPVRGLASERDGVLL